MSAHGAFNSLTEEILLLGFYLNASFKIPAMSDSSCRSPEKNSQSNVSEGCEGQGSEDEGKRMKKREKNRVAAQKSRKRHTQRADLLHQTCELLEQRNRKLRREVDSLSEEQRHLSDTLRAHEPLCPIMHCSLSSSSPQPDTMTACRTF
ncbi:basic leucine zipper transcriptional factor ATF-like 3 isoform X2 [Eleginops maclovinus]|uniref:basic leucine zipper transcriptional factor ATF-like 3 isoform X2 n=1 Tax=Eleginops maclovinus TaxID=56733 RepID=UPI0030801789